MKRILVSPVSPRARDESGWVLLSEVKDSQDGRFRTPLQEPLTIITQLGDLAMGRLYGIAMDLNQEAQWQK